MEQRLDAYAQCLRTVEERCHHFLKTNKGAVIVENSTRRSLGVTTILTNYYSPSEKECTELDEAEDRGSALNFIAFKPTLDAETYNEFVEELGERRFTDTHGSYVELDSLFHANGMVPAYEGEFKLGSNLICCRDRPSGDAEIVHLTGAIDMIKYNRRTGKLVLVELKTGNTSRAFFTMKQLFVKQKHVRQLQSYAYLLRNMFQICGVPFKSNNFELVIAGVDNSVRKVALWSVRYEPTRFLGEDERWQPLIRNIFRLSGDSLPCSQCAAPATHQWQRDTRVFFCGTACKDLYKNQKGIE